MNEKEWFEAWSKQCKEWQDIASSMVKADKDKRGVTASQVSLEQKKRALAEGRKLVTYHDLLKIKTS